MVVKLCFTLLCSVLFNWCVHVAFMYWSSSGQGGVRFFGDGCGRDADGFMVQLPLGIVEVCRDGTSAKLRHPRRATQKAHEHLMDSTKRNSHKEADKP